MKYMGSKLRLAKYLLPIILKNRQPGQLYVEPFVGGANIIQHVPSPALGIDNNYYLIELLKAVQRGWIPPTTVTEDDYRQVKASPDKYPAHTVAFVGFCCSYAGKWWGGYARNARKRNYALEASNNLRKQAPNIRHVTFKHQDYQTLELPTRSLIYCDPPYQGTTRYSRSFNHDAFWDWARKQHQNGHTIFISEQSAPPEYKLVWQRERNTTVDKNIGGKTIVESLFTL